MLSQSLQARQPDRKLDSPIESSTARSKARHPDRKLDSPIESSIAQPARQPNRLDSPTGSKLQLKAAAQVIPCQGHRTEEVSLQVTTPNVVALQCPPTPNSTSPLFHSIQKFKDSGGAISSTPSSILLSDLSNEQTRSLREALLRSLLLK